MIRLFLGFDKSQPVAFHVCAHSLLRRSSIPVSITPVRKESLERFFTRPRGPYDSTEFSITRFLVPFLSDFQGFSVFMDGDMVCLGDVAELCGYMTMMDHYGTAVRVVKHDYKPKEETKFLGALQTQYNKKNWSSVMIFNNALCTALTPDYVERMPGLHLHQFGWCKANQIASMPKRWNWLIGEPGYENLPEDAAIVHYTKGTPCLEEYKGCNYAYLWHAEYVDMLNTVEVKMAKNPLPLPDDWGTLPTYTPEEKKKYDAESKKYLKIMGQNAGESLDTLLRKHF